jgi:hypothetical protein
LGQVRILNQPDPMANPPVVEVLPPGTGLPLGKGVPMVQGVAPPDLEGEYPTIVDGYSPYFLPQHAVPFGDPMEFDPYCADTGSPWGYPGHMATLDGYGQAWVWQVQPDGLLYRAYLAGPKESRFAGVIVYEEDQGWFWDVTLGGRVGLLRYGTPNSFRPEGWQLDIEGAAFPRLDFEEDFDMTSADFRFGVPLTYARGMFEAKLAFYHLSSHIGDEFLLKNPGFTRINYSRDAFVFGLATYLSENIRAYVEAGYAFNTSGGTEPWEFQLGIEYAPVAPTHFRGAPFVAVNALLREESDFGGTFTAQAGWQWRGRGSRHVLRGGVQYLTGKSPQFQFFDTNEHQLGVALWYDY